MKIPVFVLSGFLGSGKTTLLLQLIREAGRKGLKPGILMNELGRQDVDGQILTDSTPGLTIEKLMDGCICCSKKSEVAGSLAKLLPQNPDLILIELTGVANPEEIADCLTEPQLLSKMYLKLIITILDAENVLDYNSFFSADKNLVHTLRRQIEVADLLIANKTDLIKPQLLPKIEKAVRKQNKQAALIFTTNSNIDMELIFAELKPIMKNPPTFNRLQGAKGTAALRPARPSTDTESKPHEHDNDHSLDLELSYSRVQSITLGFQPARPIGRKQLEKFLLNLGSKLLRAKGYLSVDKGKGVVLMQYAAQRITWETSSFDGQHYIVFIGIGLDRQTLTSDWEQLTSG